MNTEGKLIFFKQSGWLVLSTGISGVFLMGIYPIVGGNRMPIAELGIFASLLRLFMIMGIATSGLQIVMAQDSAAAVTPARERELRQTAAAVSRGIFFFWVGLAIIGFFVRDWLQARLKITNPAAVWVTFGLVLCQLFLPFAQGLLQGAQNFAWFGWSLMLNGVGRFVGMAVAIYAFHGHSTAALTAALFGLSAAVLVALWPSRGLLASASQGFDWIAWFRRVAPLSGGIGAIVFLMNADVLFVQSYISEQHAPFYSAVAMVGVGLVTFTTPMAAVMFPKLVRSVAQSQKSDSLMLALGGTTLLGLLGAMICTVLPSLPLRIMYFNNPKLWVSAQLIPWFMWCMLPMTLANVLVGSLLAKRDFRPVPWFMAIAIGYGLELHRYLLSQPSADPFVTFKGVILRLGIFSSAILIVAGLFSFFPKRKVDAA